MNEHMMVFLAPFQRYIKREAALKCLLKNDVWPYLNALLFTETLDRF